MWYKKQTKRMEKRGIVCRGEFSGYDVEIVKDGDEYKIFMDDFNKDLQGGVLSAYHTTSSLEKAKSWVENYFINKEEELKNNSIW